MLYVVNDDKPGFIGRIGTLLGSKGINIGTFNLGRRDAGGEAVLLLSLDEEVGPDVIAEAAGVEGVKTVKALSF
jgi:D-3-phosphoglycerate dehydrogenase